MSVGITASMSSRNASLLKQVSPIEEELYVTTDWKSDKFAIQHTVPQVRFRKIAQVCALGFDFSADWLQQHLQRGDPLIHDRHDVVVAATCNHFGCQCFFHVREWHVVIDDVDACGLFKRCQTCLVGFELAGFHCQNIDCLAFVRPAFGGFPSRGLCAE